MKNCLMALFVFFACASHAQDFPYGKIKEADFNIQSALLDSSSQGIVMNEYGYANIELSPIQGKGFEIEYYYHVVLKVLNKEGYDQANFSVPLYLSSNNSNRETLVDVKGYTYNLDAGKVVKTELSKENVITEKTSKTYNQVKIAFPQVKEGSIVELRYKTKSPFLFSLNTWPFQSDIPKIRSEFVTRIPEICTYRVNLKGTIPLGNRNVENYNTNLSSEVGEIRGDKTSYLMENIPAFISEDYMTAAKNFTSILTFELARYSIPFGPNETFSLTWADVHKSLLEDENFGGQLKRKNQLKDLITPVVQNVEDPYDKAVKIYNYVKQQVKWNQRHSIFADIGIKKALETRTGNSADINLALVSALNFAGLPAEAIILSTRENGFAGIYSAGISEFNHVIARVEINGQHYFLDASAVYEPFGNLPLKCINYQGRNIPLQGTSDWVPLQANLISTLHVNFIGDLDTEGSLKGKLTFNRGGYGASDKRESMDTYNSIEEYFEGYEKRLTHMSISTPSVENRENCEMLLKEEMDVEFANFATVHDNELHFNPIVYGKTEKNPFNLASRTYPVDIGSKLQENYSFVIRVPEGYNLTAESLGNKLNIALPNRDARFIYSVAQEGNLITVQVLMQINKDIFLPEEYFDLKEFFSRIIQTEKTSLVLANQ
ncbi:DUF3857 domain-containing protein [Sphingobacterium sp. LRF_L2]|uniref:DUF3857 domain-containing protein n=1 Tax=Sphingobacterium sp. LRF_L2 TaxID=3369421 RepID=UPI003F62C7BC